VDVAPGASVTNLTLGEFTLADDLQDHFFLVVAELKKADGELVSRSVYWPRCLKLMEDADFRRKYRETPQPSLNFDHGPWLKDQVAAQPTSLQLGVVSAKNLSANRSHLEVHVRNAGRVPAFLTHLDIAGAQRAFYATDNYFWLAPGEERTLGMEVLWRDPATRNKAEITVAAWNARTEQVALAPR
jgi:beta-mannosidase